MAMGGVFIMFVSMVAKQWPGLNKAITRSDIYSRTQTMVL